MHMADALISPAVGGTMWAVTGGLVAACARKMKTSMKDTLVPMMGVLGAFVFTAQMINFSIPGTGSSGHLGGGLLLAALLGPYAAFLVMASVLTVQALFFADGGLLALGCNIFNLGFFPAFVAYPLIFRPLAGHAPGRARLGCASLAAAVAALQLGAFSVVLETQSSGLSDLPFRAFVLLMQPVHLAIGIVEGLATAAVVAFVARARPDALFGPHACPAPDAPRSLRFVLTALLLAAALFGGALSWFASSHPDGLEWSLAKAAGSAEPAVPESAVHRDLAALQARTAVLPDYGFKSAGPAAEETEASAAPWPAVSAGTSVSGLVGGLLTLGVAALIGLALKKRRTAA
jgi:cobalt/nickel transport system permease protein